MSSEPKTPLGFCPYCDYPTDPGRCPECGQEVSGLHLVAKPRRQGRRRWIVRGLVFVAVFSAGFAVNYFQTTPSLHPTFLLLLLQGDENHQATIELARRYTLNQLSPTQAQRMFDQALDLGPLEVPEGPYPPHTPIPVSMACRFRLPALTGILSDTIQYEFTARIDEHRSVARPLLLASQVPGARILQETIIEGVATAEAGPHTVTAELTIVARESLIDPARSTVSVRELKNWKLTRSVPFVLEAAAESHMARVVEMPELAAQIEISVMRNPRDAWGPVGCLLIRCPASSSTLAGQVWVRIDDDEEYQLVGSLGVCGGEADATESRVDLKDSLRGFDSAKKVDVRIVPDLAVLLKCLKLRPYNGTVLELPGVLVEPAYPSGKPTDDDDE